MDANPKVQQLITSYNALYERWRPFRIEQYRNYDYVIGKMIDDDVRGELKKARRPVFEFQLASQPVEFITGKLKRDFARMKAVPVSTGDERSSELRTQIVNWGIGQDGYRAIAEAAVDATIGKIGWTNNYWSMKQNPEGLYKCESVDPFLVMGDPESRRNNQEDWRFVTYTPWLSAEEIIQIYQKYLSSQQIEEIQKNASDFEGSYKKNTLPKGWFERILGSSNNTFSTTSSRNENQLVNNYMNAAEGLYLTVEWHDRRSVSRKVMHDAGTKEFEVLEDEQADDANYLQQVAGSLKQLPTGEQVQRFVNPTVRTVTAEMIYITSICPALLPNDLLAETPYKVHNKGFSLKPIYFRRVHPDITKSQSLLDRLIAPIDFYNQRQMTSLEIAMDAVNPNTVAPVESIDPKNIDDWTGKKRGIIKFYNPVATGKPEREFPQDSAFQMLKVLSEEGKDMEEFISGIGMNARGYQESSGESGKLFHARSAQTEIMISDLFTNVKDATRYIFNFAGELMRKEMTLPRMIRLLSDDENRPQWVEINMPTLQGVKNDITQGEYDFIPDTAIMGETQKRENVAMLMDGRELVANDPIASHYLASIIFENSDISAAKEFGKWLKNRMLEQAGLETNNQFNQTASQDMELAARAKALMQSNQPVKEKQK